MLRTTITRGFLRPSLTAARAMSTGEGAAGSGWSRPAGNADSFTKREKALEDQYIREQERLKLKELKVKLQQQRQHLDELDKHIDDLTKGQGGEQN